MRIWIALLVPVMACGGPTENPRQQPAAPLFEDVSDADCTAEVISAFDTPYLTALAVSAEAPWVYQIGADVSATGDPDVLQIWDASDPTNLEERGSIAFSSASTIMHQLAAHGDVVALTFHDYDNDVERLVLFDVSDRDNPSIAYEAEIVGWEMRLADPLVLEDILASTRARQVGHRAMVTS